LQFNDEINRDLVLAVDWDNDFRKEFYNEDEALVRLYLLLIERSSFVISPF